MTRGPARTTATVAVLVLVALALTAAVAWAHARLREATVPASSEQTLTMVVPVEREGDHTVTVAIQVPPPFEVTACAPPADPWTCEVEEPDDDGTVVRWQRDGGAPPPDAPEDEFPFEVTTPADQGEHELPTVQTYASGETVRWIGEQDGDRPSPVLEVGPPDVPVATNPAAGETHTELTPASPSPPDSPSPSPSPEPTVPSPSPTVDPPVARAEGTGLVILVAVLAVLVLGGLVLYARHR